MTRPDSAREIRLTREYDAPLSMVWEAFTDLAQVSQWWGPRGFSITTHSKDLRPGGTWVYTMHGPDGTDYPNFTRYLEVETGARLVYDHGATSEDTAPMFRVTALFRDLAGRTRLDLCLTFASPEAAVQARAFIKTAGGDATWDRLAEHLEKQRSREEIFVINRRFDAPIETLFDMFALPEHLAAWLPPTGFTMRFHRVAIAPGGDAFYAMTNGAFTMHGRIEYQAVDRPHRIEYTQCFTDEHERIARHPGAPTWPETMRTIVRFSAEGPAQTRVTIRWSVFGTAAPDEIAAFVAERGGMTKGWTGSFDKLEALLSVDTASAASGTRRA